MIFEHAGISTSVIWLQLRNSEAEKKEKKERKRGEVCLGEPDCVFSGSLDRRQAPMRWMCNGQISVWPKGKKDREFCGVKEISSFFCYSVS
jgi:hypothetical protein